MHGNNIVINGKVVKFCDNAVKPSIIMGAIAHKSLAWNA